VTQKEERRDEKAAVTPLHGAMAVGGVFTPERRIQCVSGSVNTMRV